MAGTLFRWLSKPRVTIFDRLLVVLQGFALVFAFSVLAMIRFVIDNRRMGRLMAWATGKGARYNFLKIVLNFVHGCTLVHGWWAPF